MGMFIQKRSNKDNIRDQIEVALQEQPLDSERKKRADELMKVATSGGTVAVNWRALFVSLAIFSVLLFIAFFVDWKNMVDDPSFYNSLAATAFGAVSGFLAGDAAATAVS